MMMRAGSVRNRGRTGGAGRVVLALCCLLVASGAAGEEPDLEEVDWPRITGEVGFGALSTTGNVDSDQVRLDASARIEYEYWRHRFEYTGLHAGEGGDTIAQRQTGRAQSDYRITRRSYLFGSAGFEAARFLGWDRRRTLAAGLGRRFVDGPRVVLELEAGPGRRWQREAGSNATESESIVRYHGELIWSVTADTRLGQEIEVEDGSANRFTESESWIESRLVGSLFLRLSHLLQHNSDVPEGRARTDTWTAVTLNYRF